MSKPQHLYTVRCEYDVTYYRIEVVRASSREEACVKAMVDANSTGNWDSFDDAGDTYVGYLRRHGSRRQADLDDTFLHKSQAIPLASQSAVERLDAVTKERDALKRKLDRMRAANTRSA